MLKYFMCAGNAILNFKILDHKIYFVLLNKAMKSCNEIIR